MQKQQLNLEGSFLGVSSQGSLCPCIIMPSFFYTLNVYCIILLNFPVSKVSRHTFLSEVMDKFRNERFDFVIFNRPDFVTHPSEKGMQIQLFEKIVRDTFNHKEKFR